MSTNLDPSIHPAPSTMALAAYPCLPGDPPAESIAVREARRIAYERALLAERSRILASPSAALDLLLHAIGENPVLVAVVRDLVTPHLPTVKP